MITYTADFLSDGKSPLISATQHHFVDNNLLCSSNDAVRAYNSANSAKTGEISCENVTRHEEQIIGF